MNKPGLFGRCLTALVYLVALAGCGGGGSGESTPTASNNANLSGLSLSAGTLNPAFNPATTAYTVDAVLENSIAVTATLADSNASMRINGNNVSSGVPSAAIALAVGTNILSVQVTAENGTTVKTYSITVTRIVAANQNADLNSLSVSAGLLNTAFESNTLNYSVNVASNVTSTTVTASTAEGAATFTINGNAATSSIPSSSINLNVGANPITVIVTASDGVTTKTYTVTVIRAGVGSSNANLSDLTLSYGALDQAFDAAQTIYTSTVKFMITSIQLTPTTQDSNAVVTINNLPVTSGQASMPVALAEGNNIIDVVVTSQDGSVTKTYTVTFAREMLGQLAQQVIIKSNSGESLNFGGIAVAQHKRNIVIDGDTMVIASMFDEAASITEVISGVYVYQRINGVWTFQQRLERTFNFGTAEGFGTNIDIDGDTIVVSAPTANSPTVPGAILSGVVYVYTRNGGTWSFDQVIEPNVPQAILQFGAGMALEGDTLVVGAPSLIQDVAGIVSAAGGVFVFTRSGSTWTQQTVITPSNLDIADGFGANVALHGTTLVATSPGERSNTTGINGNEDDNSITNGSGAAYIFSGSGNSWTQEAYVKSDVVTSGFASAIDVYGDTVAVASSEDVVYVYVKTTSGWVRQQAVKTALTGFSYPHIFGTSINLYKDTLAVGDSQHGGVQGGFNTDQTDATAPATGAAYVFARSNGVWSEQVFIKPTVPTHANSSGERFGSNIALDADTLAVAAIGHVSDATGIFVTDPERFGRNIGAVYIFE